MPIKRGKQFIERINEAMPEVWLRGKRIKGRLSDHPAFRGLVTTQAALYEMQSMDEYRHQMTYESPVTGDPVGLSFLQPKTKEDMRRRKTMMMLWGRRHHGLLGRSPDYMNTGLMALYSAAELLAEQGNQYADNMRRYYEYCRDNDITLSHAFIQPQASRFADLLEDGSIVSSAAKVVERHREGIIVHGAFLLATQGITSDEILVYPPASSFMHEENNPCTFAFAVPINLPGIKWICRESLVVGDSTYDYPLSSRFEEMDALVIFDHVMIPWDRVFILGSDHLSMQFFAQSNFHVHSAYQVLCRYIAKTEFVLGIVSYMAEVQEKASTPAVVEQITEILMQLETLKGLLIASEEGAELDQWGSMLPARKPLWAANLMFPKIYPQMIELIQLLGGSSVIMIPSEQDLRGQVQDDLKTYLKGSGVDAEERVSLFRLAWELSTGGFGGRQLLYERFFFGDRSVLVNRLFSSFTDKEHYIDDIKRFLSE